MPQEFTCWGIYDESKKTSAIVCSFGGQTETISLKTARSRATKILLVAATAAVEANAAMGLMCKFTAGESPPADIKATIFNGLLRTMRASRCYDELDGMQPNFEAEKMTPMVSIAWSEDEVRDVSLEDARKIAETLLACLESTNTDAWLRQAAQDIGRDDEHFAHVCNQLSRHRKEEAAKALLERLGP